VSAEIRIPFTPPHVSVNRVRIVDLPGLPMDEDVRGQQAYHLLSSEAVTRYAAPFANALHLPPADNVEKRRAVPRRVDAALTADDSAARTAAQAIGRRLGRNLGYLLLTLHRGDAVNRAARAEWSTADWERWARIRQVWVGGGMVSGRLGELIVATAQTLLETLGDTTAPQVKLTPYGGELALMGAARYLPAGARSALAFDFGHTWVKRARVTVVGNRLARLEPLPSIPTDWVHRNVPTSAQRYTGAEVLDFVADVLAEALRAHPVACPDVVGSIAAYVRGGELLGNGIYARLSELSEDVRPLITKAVGERLGRRITFHPIHDGTAAAALHAGAPHQAVIVIGTALGVGFPPASATGLLNVTDTLQPATC
jgi:hypothetical protein